MSPIRRCKLVWRDAEVFSECIRWLESGFGACWTIKYEILRARNGGAGEFEWGVLEIWEEVEVAVKNHILWYFCAVAMHLKNVLTSCRINLIYLHEMAVQMKEYENV